CSDCGTQRRSSLGSSSSTTRSGSMPNGWSSLYGVRATSSGSGEGRPTNCGAAGCVSTAIDGALLLGRGLLRRTRDGRGPLGAPRAPLRVVAQLGREPARDVDEPLGHPLQRGRLEAVAHAGEADRSGDLAVAVEDRGADRAEALADVV